MVGASLDGGHRLIWGHRLPVGRIAMSVGFGALIGSVAWPAHRRATIITYALNGSTPPLIAAVRSQRIDESIIGSYLLIGTSTSSQ